MKALVKNVLILATVVAPHAAQADIVRTTWVGTVSAIYGTVDLFGSDLAIGDAYTATFLIDTSKGSRIINSIESDVLGGYEYGDSTPNLMTSLTINGYTFSFVGVASAESLRYQGAFGNIADDSLSNHFDYNLDQNLYNISGGDYPTTLSGDFTYHRQPADSSAFFSYFTLPDLSDQIGLSPETVTQTVLSSVPLPPSGSLFGAALIALGSGYAAKRKAKATASSQACAQGHRRRGRPMSS